MTGAAGPGPDPAPAEDQGASPRIFVGRRLEIAQITSALQAGSSVLVKGRPGIGKRALLREVRAGLAGQRVCLAPSVTTAKQLAADLAEQVHAAIGLAVPERLIPPRFRAAAQRTGQIEFRHIRRSLTREPVADQLALVRRSLAGRDGVILFISSLEVPPTQADMLLELAGHCQLCAAMEPENRRARIQRLLWRFQVTIELKPLVAAETQAWVGQWLAQNPVTFASPRIRQAFERAVVRDSGGIPAAIQGLLDLALVERSVTRETIRALHHEAAIDYLDMTPILIILAAGFMALRYISRGMGMQELMVLAGVGTSLFYLLLYFGRMMRARR